MQLQVLFFLWFQVLIFPTLSHGCDAASDRHLPLTFLSRVWATAVPEQELGIGGRESTVRGDVYCCGGLQAVMDCGHIQGKLFRADRKIGHAGLFPMLW